MSATLTDRYPTVCLSTLEEEVIEKAALLVFGVCVCVCVCVSGERRIKKKKKKLSESDIPRSGARTAKR